MRIVGGRHRGRPLSCPEGNIARPTQDRTRESLFNILLQGDVSKGLLPSGTARLLVDQHVLDVFAGTGALGLEALSRGARKVTFIEKAPESLAALRENVKSLREQVATHVIAADVLAPPKATEACSLILMDAPYNQGLSDPAIAALDRAGWIAPTALIAAEAEAKETLTAPPDFELVDTRKYGKARIFFFLRTEAV
ncbi:16S rRNA (guanine(966)-N(2))-methyltransferase RsmD [Kiloniella laminariae]|uniref:16S rRNA (Guanine(966)-N(2))-methyltransferase RsmD n=1 Tax=Kiloniella laminariae TaxID=454162 RepID=A0ABT4LKZ8_9PROT|nr:16S rRNA (guanine(966)-N(2))-methyltransferase RsmD [Kiloniella laminariae]MCZ4281747.1 16S rRNA (guanine(966)-N(2))-methyltransferase RsmD [Kiloniella laminariae]